MTTNDNPKPGTPEWWRLWQDYRNGLSQSRQLLDQLTGEAVYAKGLEAQEGFAACIEMLDEAVAALRKATDARRALHDLTGARPLSGSETQETAPWT